MSQSERPAQPAYARAGVDQARAHAGVAAIVSELARAQAAVRSLVPDGHYAAVIDAGIGHALALATDGVGSKLVVAERLGRFDTVGVDCVAMNVNDVVCVGAKPLAFLDYVAVEEPDQAMLAAIGKGLAEGARRAGVVVPGGELAVVPDLLRGHPSPRGFDLVGFCLGIAEPKALVTGERIQPGDVIIGLPSSGIHANGLTLARAALSDLEERPPELQGRSVGEELLEPTEIYVPCILDLLASGVDVHGLAHITGDGLLNLLRLGRAVGYRVEEPLPTPPIFRLIQRRGEVSEAEMWEVFNMGCGFCCVVAEDAGEAALSVVRDHYPAAAAIGTVSDRAGVVELPRQALVGRRGEGFEQIPT